MRATAEEVASDAISWPDAVVFCVLIICGAAVFIAMITGD